MKIFSADFLYILSKIIAACKITETFTRDNNEIRSVQPSRWNSANISLVVPRDRFIRRSWRFRDRPIATPMLSHRYRSWFLLSVVFLNRSYVRRRKYRNSRRLKQHQRGRERRERDAFSMQHSNADKAPREKMATLDNARLPRISCIHGPAEAIFRTEELITSN